MIRIAERVEESIEKTKRKTIVEVRRILLNDATVTDAEVTVLHVCMSFAL